jgi:hypothetical protein
MPARFDDLIPYFGNEVIAIGPLHPSEKLKEICTWVYQPTADRANDAAATEMTTHAPATGETTAHEHFQQVDGVRWALPMKRVSQANFVPGKAFAVAVALVVDRAAPNNERVVWWGQPVDLYENADDVAAAHLAGALERPPLNTPRPFPTAD